MEDKIKSFITKNNVWRDELTILRALLLKSELHESLKWGMPSYECNGQNVIGLGAFKNHVGLWFHQGALLSDPHKVLINAQEGKTKAMRSIRITKHEPIDPTIVDGYIQEAIENAKKGKYIQKTKSSQTKRIPIKMPEELAKALASIDNLQETFSGLTIIQQHDYIAYIASTKRDTTKASRLLKIIPLIQAGKPINNLWTKS